MAYSYSQLLGIKARIETDLEASQNQLATARAAFTSVAARLTAMQSQYTGWATEVNDFQTANPTDNAAVVLKAQKNALIAEFATAKTVAQALETAVAGV